MAYIVDYTGQQFGNWKVIERDLDKNKQQGSSWWIVECTCPAKTRRSTQIAKIKNSSGCNICKKQTNTRGKNTFVEFDDYIEGTCSVSPDIKFKISKEDLENVSKSAWRLNGAYMLGYREGKRTGLHRLIMNCIHDPILVDHINGDTLDNRRENLRLVTHAENMCNRINQPNNTGVPGVSLEKNRYIARISHQGKRIYLGCFKTLKKAKEVREKAEKEYWGEHAPNREIIDK